MPKTKAQIIAEAQVVKNATEVGENTATRVGGVLEDLADADGMVIIPVTGTQSGDNITLSSNPFTQVQTAVNAGQHVVVRVTIASDIIDFTMNTYSASVATYIGTANFLQNEFQLLCSASSAVITNRSTSNTFSTGESVPNVGIDATPTQGSDNLVTSGGVAKEIYGEPSTNETITLDITAGVGVTQAGSKRLITLLPNRIYKLDISGDRTNGTIITLYPRASMDNDVIVRSKSANSESGISQMNWLNSQTITANITSCYIQVESEVQMVKFYASDTQIKDTTTLGFTFSWQSDDTGIDGRITALEDSVSDLDTRLGLWGLNDKFRVGNISITVNGWSYSDSSVRVSTKPNETIPLKKGNVVGLSNWGNLQMYVGYRRANGTYGTGGGWLRANYTCPEDGEYVFNFQPVSDVETITNIFFVKSADSLGHHVDVLENHVNDIEDRLEDISGEGNLSYYGDGALSFNPTAKEFKCNRQDFVEQYYSVGGVVSDGALTKFTQSMAIYNDKIFLFMDSIAENNADAGYSFAVMDYNSKAIIYRGMMPSQNSHHNNAQFLDVFYNENDTFPLLLMSRGDYPDNPNANKFYIMRIVESAGVYTISIIKTITCTLPQAKYNGSWICDNANSRLYLYTMSIGDWQTPEADGNIFVIYEFDMFDATNTEDLTLTSNDVRKITKFNYWVLQGGTCWGGKLYLPIQNYTKINGLTPAITSHIVAVINPVSGKVENMIPSDSMENEGIAIYNGKIYVSSKNGSGSSSTTTPVFKIQEFSFD